MLSLSSRIEASASRGGAVTFVGGDQPDRVEWERLFDEARGMAAIMQARGVQPGDHVALLGPTSRDLVTAIAAVWMAGATIVVMPIPMRMASIDEFISATRRRLQRADVVLFAIDPELAPFIEPQAGDPPMVRFDELRPGAGRPTAAAFERPADDVDRLAILQFTSGSTSGPQGGRAPAPRRRQQPRRARPSGRVRSATPTCWCRGCRSTTTWVWSGLLSLSMTSGADFVLGAPQDFMASPSRWMQWISDYGGTATAGTELLLRARHPSAASAPRGSTCQACASRSTAPNPSTPPRRGFLDAAVPHGMPPGAVFPAFGMAEVAIAGTFPPPLAGLRTDTVDRRVLESERYAAPAEPDADRSARGSPCSEGRCPASRSASSTPTPVTSSRSERSASSRSGAPRCATATTTIPSHRRAVPRRLAAHRRSRLHDRRRAGHVRSHQGRHHRRWAQRVPRGHRTGGAEVDGVRAGNVIAFGVEGRNGKEAIVVVAETKLEDTKALHATINEHVRSVVGVPAKDIVLVPPSTLPKTSSGKLQRSLCRERYLGTELQRV
jgi:fatty-acyl-CoA synthase